jgi:hypothetical protein
MRIYAKGDRVSQTTYGTGTVVEADATHTVIDFDAHGLRRFATAKVTLARTSVAAPERPVPKPRARRTPRR